MKQDRKSRQVHGAPPAPPHVGTQNGQPLDGRQYVDVIEEQRYADSRPTLDTSEPRTLHPTQGRPLEDEREPRARTASERRSAP